MIGISGAIFDIAIVVVLALATTVAATSRKGLSSHIRALTVGVFGLLFVFAGMRVFLQWISIRELRNIKPQQIVTVAVGSRSISDPKSIGEFTSTFSNARWYSAHKSDWGAETPMDITLATTAHVRLKVAFYTRGGAAIVRFERRVGPAVLMGGYSFVPNLDGVLRSQGIAVGS